nr:phospholipase D-like domain-containing protein [Aliiroseovarius sp. S2029]
MMRFGLIEVRIAPEPALAMTEAARAHLLAGRSLPERAQRREMTVSLVFDKLGGSVFRGRNVAHKPLKQTPKGATIVDFPDSDEAETDSSMEERVRHLLSSSLRPGELFAIVRANLSSIEKRYIHLDLDRARDGALPEGASSALRAAVREHLASGRLPAARPSQPVRPACLDTPIKTTLVPDQILFGGGDHLARLEEVVDVARSDVFVLSTFVAAQDDEKARLGQDRVWAALERAVRRGVRVHLFFGSSLNGEGKHTRAMAELQHRLRAAGAGVATHLEPVHSHAKIVIADDGVDGARALLGSCNWLQSPFRAHELSIELRDGAVAHCLDLFGAITAAVPTARDSRDAMQAMRTALRLKPGQLLESAPTEDTIPVSLRILAASDHLPLLRRAAHDADERLVVMTHRMGSPMIQNVFDPAQLASERIATVQALYSLPSPARMSASAFQRVSSKLIRLMGSSASRR